MLKPFLGERCETIQLGLLQTIEGIGIISNCQFLNVPDNCAD